ncbi:MAG: radical SAM protein, partial [Candidatus Cloacimonetes bacterium]|nr:radical SAM protein [Candidatus Cloacimonadota bacterium]
MKIFPVFIPHFGCPFQCIYCNQKFITKVEKPLFDDIKKQIENFCKNNSGIEKEIAFFGGTFTSLSKDEQRKCFELVKPFETEISGIRISTRPDSINDEILSFCKENNIKTIELGIQSFDDEVLTASRRGYNAKTALNSCELVKSYNFNLGVQLMPG